MQKRRLWKHGLFFFEIREINRPYYGMINKRKDDYMLWVGIALILIGVFLVGKSSN